MPNCLPGMSSRSDRRVRCSRYKTVVMRVPVSSPTNLLSSSSRSAVETPSIAQVKYPRSSLPPLFLTPQIQSRADPIASSLKYIQHPTSFHHCIYRSPAPLDSHLLIPPGSSWSPFPPFCFSWGVLYTQKSGHVTSQLRHGLHCTAPGSP